MQKGRYTAALLMLCGWNLLAQHSNNGNNNAAVDPAQYWNAPDETDRDSKGNITYTEIKDAKSFTRRVFLYGQWSTYHYRPGTVEITRIDTRDSTDELVYDAAGNFAGVTVHAGGKAHTLRYDRAKGTVTADNMPTVTVEHDPTSPGTRDLIVRSGKSIVASIVYASTGEVASVNVGAMTLSLTPTENGIKEKLTANGAVLKEATATIAVRRTFTVLLDPVADRLHIGKDWVSDTRSRKTPSGFLSSIERGANVIARVVHVGEMEAVFAGDGTPLFYDITVDYGAGGDAQRSDYRMVALYAAALPTHIIITADGEAGAYVETPGSGSIRAFWTSRSGGHTLYNHIVYDAGIKSSRAAGRPATLAGSGTGASHLFAASSRVVSPTVMMMCDSSQICTDGGTDCPSCGGCSTSYYYCDSGGGSGTFTPPPSDDSGGGPTGGTSAAPGNHVYDTETRIAVDRAIEDANAKLSEPTCGVELLKNATWDGTSAYDALTSRGGGESAKDWFAEISWQYGEGKKDPSGVVACQNASAWTTPGSKIDYVCKIFIKVKFPGDKLIHEMLHTLGMPECNGLNCPNPAWKTPAQIDSLVEQYCGAN